MAQTLLSRRHFSTTTGQPICSLLLAKQYQANPKIQHLQSRPAPSFLTTVRTRKCTAVCFCFCHCAFSAELHCVIVNRKKSLASALSGVLCDWFCSQGNFCCPWAHEDSQMSLLCKFSTNSEAKRLVVSLDNVSQWISQRWPASSLARNHVGVESQQRFPSCAFPAGVFKAKLTFRLIRK